jgi:hypothetical protein
LPDGRPDVRPGTPDLAGAHGRWPASTLRQAADLDFPLCVLSDACADGDPEVHRVLTTKVFPRQADVLTVVEWATTLKAA